MCATKILKKISKTRHSAKFPLKLFIMHLVQTVSVTETAIHEDTRPILPKHQVRMSRQPLMVQPIPESPTPQPFTHNHFRLRVLRPNSCHVIVPLLCREFIHIRLFFQFSYHLPIRRQPVDTLQFIFGKPLRSLVLL